MPPSPIYPDSLLTTNPLCRLLGIRYPIILGGMRYWGRAPLVAAVSQAGGLGVLGAAAMPAEELRREISQVKALTSLPFGINISVMAHRRAETRARIAIEESVPVVTTSAGSPQRFTALLGESGIKVIHVVPTVSHALKAQEAGVHAIVAEGAESGGYINRHLVSTFALLPQVADAVQVPVIAAGGIADARGLVAALALGASGVQMGTRFLATRECRLPEEYAKALLLAGDTDTVAIPAASGAKRQLTEEILTRARGDRPPSPDMHLKAGSGLAAGQCAGLIKEVLPAEEIIHRMIKQAGSVLESIHNSLAG